jgi:hypothetical protein
VPNIVHEGVHSNRMVLIAKPKSKKFSKGYRLRPSTHKLIDKLQVMMKADQDTVINKACKMLYKELKQPNL